MSKQLMRKNMKDKLSRLDSDLYILYSEQIKTNFIKEISSLNVRTIGLTISAFPEVNTEGIIHALWELGRTVVVPKCTPQDRSMTFYRIEDYNQLETVYMNLKEPNPKLTTAVEPSSIDLLIVPGIVYSKSGYRIGYGGGYYDRFLSNYKGKSLSLAFDMQLVDEIVSEDFDLPVDSIITERTTIMCKENREMGGLT
ncbi:5-formyltetrahydrofolate cyclo-ligase [Psychrobacillus sp. FSL K6-1267]|jgi:5-formyltetrahydrofolate cyclo-ligase|uniref:5-formyltetrahydrofolate cyclo-ligase n=1 Tax=Psychrobacillus sp. FSL K6-1267 TaxID=2921543 RepID=UPI0012AF9E91|nr:5-formyltetrahydrofolate cyclo-ligase [Bacillus sp. N3536]